MKQHGATKVQRGRKSAGSREIALLVSPGDAIARPEPPAELSAEERYEWIDLCNALPATYFPPATRMMLVQYCRHVVVGRHYAKLIHHCEDTVPFDEERYAKLCRCQRQETLAIYSCLRAMRLTHLASYATDRAAIPTEMAKPWEG
jgi:hypothetical protein